MHFILNSVTAQLFLDIGHEIAEFVEVTLGLWSLHMRWQTSCSLKENLFSWNFFQKLIFLEDYQIHKFLKCLCLKNLTIWVPMESTTTFHPDVWLRGGRKRYQTYYLRILVQRATFYMFTVRLLFQWLNIPGGLWKSATSLLLISSLLLPSWNIISRLSAYTSILKFNDFNEILNDLCTLLIARQVLVSNGWTPKIKSRLFQNVLCCLTVGIVETNNLFADLNTIS